MRDWCALGGSEEEAALREKEGRLDELRRSPRHAACPASRCIRLRINQEWSRVHEKGWNRSRWTRESSNVKSLLKSLEGTMTDHFSNSNPLYLFQPLSLLVRIGAAGTANVQGEDQKKLDIRKFPFALAGNDQTSTLLYCLSVLMRDGWF